MLMGDFNINLLNYESHESVADFIDNMYPWFSTMHKQTYLFDTA